MRSLRSYRLSQRSAFTLIELMLVVLILGVLAGIVGATMRSPTEQAREATLRGQLRAMRSQILLYKLQHGDTPPTGAVIGDLLTRRSDAAGNLSPDGDPQMYPLGPYLVSIPANPYNGRTDITEVAAGAALAPNDASGWLYQVDGPGGFSFVANSARNDTSGKPLVEY